MAGSIELSIRLFSETEPAVARLFTESGERTARRDGVLFLRAGGQVYSCKDSPEARKLFEAFCGREEGKMDSGSETQLLRDVLVGLTDAACLRRFGIAGKSTRCVAVFRSARQEARLLKEIIPMEKADHLTMMENGDLALVLQTEERSTEEVYEFVAAAAGTMESEAGIGCWAGIGRNVEEAEKLPEKPGVREILTFFREEGIPIAVASSSPSDLVGSNLTRAGIKEYFDAIIGGDQVEQGKPAPDIFLKAAEEIGCKPEDCYVFEDGKNGLSGARAAGCSPVMIIDTMRPDRELAAICTGVFESLTEALEAIRQGRLTI